MTFISETYEKRSGKASEHERELLAVFTDGRHVHNWQQLLHVVHQQLVEEAFIALLQCSQVTVPVQVVGHVA